MASGWVRQLEVPILKQQAWGLRVEGALGGGGRVARGPAWVCCCTPVGEEDRRGRGGAWGQGEEEVQPGVKANRGDTSFMLEPQGDLETSSAWKADAMSTSHVTRSRLGPAGATSTCPSSLALLSEPSITGGPGLRTDVPGVAAAGSGWAANTTRPCPSSKGRSAGLKCFVTFTAELTGRCTGGSIAACAGLCFPEWFPIAVLPQTWLRS
ncbi:hypothetical protein V8C86DRAFT_2468365 [Haematococcus lacustris]